MEILGSLGIDVKLLIAQIINFGLLLWLLARFVYRPIVKRIEKDEAKLQQAQIQTQELDRQKNIFVEKKRKEMADVKKRAREIIKEAESIAVEIERQTKQEAEEEKQAVIKQIKSRLAEMEHEDECQIK